GKRSHRERPFLQPGKLEEVRDRSKGEQQVVVLKRMAVTFAPMMHGDSSGLEIDGLHFACEELNAFEQFTERVHDVGHVEIRGSDLVKHGSKQDEVVAVDQCDFDIVPL